MTYQQKDKQRTEHQRQKNTSAQAKLAKQNRNSCTHAKRISFASHTLKKARKKSEKTQISGVAKNQHNKPRGTNAQQRQIHKRSTQVNKQNRPHAHTNEPVQTAKKNYNGFLKQKN